MGLVRKLSVSMPPETIEEIRLSAEAEGMTVSAWSEAAARAAAHRQSARGGRPRRGRRDVGRARDPAMASCRSRPLPVLETFSTRLAAMGMVVQRPADRSGIIAV